MKRALLILALLPLLFSAAAWADGLNLSNQWGMVTITNAGITTNRSILMSFGGVKAAAGHGLGSVSFSTGALLTGDIWTGGTFSDVGSSFVITGSAKHLPHGVIFNGTFVGPITWSIVATQGNYYIEYALTGQIQGTYYDGRTVTGTTTQNIYSYTNERQIHNDGHILLGGTHLVVPEPGTLGLLGTGLVMIAGAFRRKFLGV